MADAGEVPLMGFDFDYQGPLDLGHGLPPLMPMQGFNANAGPEPMMPAPGFLSEQLQPAGSQPGGLPPGMPPGFDGSDVPPGLPPGFPPMDGMPPGFPPMEGMPPGFPDFPGLEPAFGPSGPPGGGLPEGPGRPDFIGAAGIGPPPSEPPPGQGSAGIGPPPSEPPPSRGPAGIGPPPSEPPPSRLADLGSLGRGFEAEGERKRKRGTIDGLASNRNIRQTGGSVTVYNGYDQVTAAASSRKSSSSAPAAVAAAVSAAAPASSSFVGVQGQEALPRQLPEGWEMKKSRSTGKVYYINEKLGKSQFEPPAGSSVKATAQTKKKKASLRAKDISVDAAHGDVNGVMGAVRAKDQNTNRWAKWQKCSQVVNAPGDEE